MVSFVILVAILIAIGVIFFRVMAGFFVPLFLAALLAVVVQPLYRWMLIRFRGYRYISAGVTTCLVLLIVLLPIGLMMTQAALEGLSLLDRLRLKDVQVKLDKLRLDMGLIIPQKDDLQRIEASLNRWHDEQQAGASPEFKDEAVDNLLQRLDAIEAWMVEQGELAPLADANELRANLKALRDSPPDSVERDQALSFSYAEFREFKRNFLGGTYRAWLAETANPSEIQVEQLRERTLSTAGSVLMFGGDTLKLAAKLLFGIIIMVTALFFLLAEGSKMLDSMVRLSPLEERYVRELVAEFDRACRAIVSATLLSAVAQGLLAGIGFYFVGLHNSAALLMVLTMVLALVPFTGAAAVWVPVCLYLYFFQNELGLAIGLAVYGTVFVSGADNVIKPLVLSGQSNLHPLLALLSVLGGIQALGPIGIVVGPMAVVFLQTLLKLVQRELSSMDRLNWSNWLPFGRTGPVGAADLSHPAAASAVATSVGPMAAVECGPATGTSASTPAPGPTIASTGNGKSTDNSKGGPKQPQSPKKRRK